MVQKPLSINKLWPIEPQEVEERLMTADMWEQIKKAHDIQ